MNIQEMRENVMCGKWGVSDTLSILDKLKHLEAENDKTCEWKEDEDGIYATSCGQDYCYELPLQDCPDVIYCQHCGKKIVAIPYKSDVVWEEPEVLK